MINAKQKQAQGSIVSNLQVLAWLTALATSLLTSSQGYAQNRAICVQCLEPEVAYRCEVKASPEHQAFLANERLSRMACIRDIAKSSGHAVCKVSKDLPADCIGGEPYVVDISELARTYVDRVPSVVRNTLTAPGPTTAEGQADTSNKGDKNEPPKTVVEMAKRTAESSQKQLENAGAAVKNAGEVVTGTVKKTWTCLASLFQDC